MDQTVLENVEVEPEVSLRDSIEQAIEVHNEPEGTEPSPQPSVVQEKAPVLGAPQSAPLQQNQPNVPATQQAPQVAPQALQAPAQWKPQVKEKWNQLPREVQEEVLRREADSMRLIGSVGHKIRLADGVAEQLQSFIPRLQEQNIPVESFVGDIFTTVKQLSTGSPVDKANVLANIIQSYGIDVGILDNVLSHRLSESPEVLQARRAMAQAQSIVEQNRTAVQGQAAERASSVVTQFAADPKHEFVGNVRFMMADLLDSGQCKTLDEAYTAAVWANPETRAILLKREAEGKVRPKTQQANAARMASQSISGAPRMGSGELPPNLGEGSLRETIAAAMDHHDSL